MASGPVSGMVQVAVRRFTGCSGGVAIDGWLATHAASLAGTSGDHQSAEAPN